MAPETTPETYPETSETTLEVLRVGPLMTELEQLLEEQYAAPRLPDEEAAASALLVEHGASVRVAATSGRTGVEADPMDLLHPLGAVVLFGVGHDRTDVAAVRARGVAVTTIPEVLSDCVAETAVALVLDVMRGLSRADGFVRTGAWGGQADSLADAEVLRALRPGYLVTVGRGSVVDEDALLESLASGALAGAGIDAYRREALVPEALIAMDRVVLLPHLASGTYTTRVAMRDLVLEKVESFLVHGAVVTPV